MVFVVTPGWLKSTRNTQRLVDVSQMRNILETHKSNNGGQLPSLADLNTEVTPSIESNYYTGYADNKVSAMSNLDSIRDNRTVQVLYEQDPNSSSKPTDSDYIDVDEMHIWGGRKCVNETIGDAKYGGAQTNVENSTSSSYAIVYRLEGETAAHCKD